MGNTSSQPMTTMSYGQQAVGLTFNPSNDPTVQKLKELYAEIIDLVYMLPVTPDQNFKSQLVRHAIMQAVDGQMDAVKAATWGFK